MVHAQTIKHSVHHATAVAVVDTDGEAARRMAEFLGGVRHFERLEDALESVPIDAVVITTPTFTHCALAVTAACAGKHLFCEKPMALSVVDCDEMIAAAESNHVALQIGFMRRFQPEFVAAKQYIDAGEIGEPMVVKSLTRGPGLPPAWARSLELSNGMLSEVNSHDFDTVRWLMGSEITRVYTEAVNFKRASHGIDDPGFYDSAVVSLRFANEGLGTIDGTCPADYGYDARVEVLGTRGVLLIGHMQSQALLLSNDRDVGVVSPSFRTWPERFRWGYIAEMTHFVDTLHSGDVPTVNGLDGRRAVEAVVAANRSRQEQRPIELSVADGG
jgi:scyllo-inositol 2-dehydrogenase (NAD+)